MNRFTATLKSILRAIALWCCAASATAAIFRTPSPEIVSAWKFNGGDAVVVFRYDGSYYLVDANTGSEGLERGTFTWNKSTGAFSVDTIVDTNGDGGLSDPIGATTVAVSGNTLSYTVAGEGTFTFSRVVNTSSAIVGSWIIPGDNISVTFLADNTYYLSEEANDPPYAVTGIEKGTYSWNPTTKVLVSNPAINTNGQAGVGGTWDVTGNILVYDDSLEGGNDITEMFRISTNSSPFALPDFFTVRYANFEQASDSAPVPETFDSINNLAPYSADAFVLSQVGASAPTLKIGAATPFSISPDSDEAGAFEDEFLFQTLTALNTFMPASSALQFKDGTGTANLTGPLGTFPSTPKITLRGGATWDAGVYAFGDDELLQWTLPSGFSASQFLTRLEIYDPLLDQDVVVAELQGDVTHFDLTGLLDPGTEYEVSLEFFRIDNSTTSGTGVFAGKRGYALAASSTTFQIRSLPGANPAVEIVSVGKEIFYVQTDASTVILDPAPITPTNGGPYGFHANVEGANVSSITAPTVTPPAGTPNTQNDPFYDTLYYDPDDLSWRYGPNANDWGDTSQAAIDARFPNGIYTITVEGVSVPLNLTGDAYPNTPQLTLTGGSWVNGKYALDSSSPLTVTTNVFTGYGSNVDGYIALGVNDQEIEHFHSSSPSTNFATLSIPANTLPTNEVTRVGADFSAIVDNSNALSGALAVASYSKSVDLEIHILPKIASQSSSQVLGAGASVTLQVTATGSPAIGSGQLDYQWKKNGVNMTGQTTASLTIGSFTVNDAAQYACTVTNDVGTATSAPINLEFADAFQSFVSGFSLNSVTNGAPDADSDNDGLDTLLEFILGGSPNAPDANLLKNATTSPTQTGRNLVFFYDRKTVANGIQQVIETSPSLSGVWTPAINGQNGVVISITTLDANTQRVTATVPTEEPKLFVRLRAFR